jgi:hypothetical protein
VSAVSVLLVETGVNMGDHGQDVITAVEVRDDETLVDAANRLLAPAYAGDVKHYAWRLEVRVVQPAPGVTP